MSPRRSSAHDVALIRSAVERALRTPPTAIDPQMRHLCEGRVGKPALVHTPENTPAYWLVPIQIGQAACGFAQVELNGRVTSIATLGAGPGDRAAWPRASFFEKPPPSILREARVRYPELAQARPVLSYDRSPAHWAWRLSAAGAAVSVYITPGGWHHRAASAVPVIEPDREG